MIETKIIRKKYKGFNYNLRVIRDKRIIEGLIRTKCWVVLSSQNKVKENKHLSDLIEDLFETFYLSNGEDGFLNYHTNKEKYSTLSIEEQLDMLDELAKNHIDFLYKLYKNPSIHLDKKIKHLNQNINKFKNYLKEFNVIKNS
jgi:hypothetical protein